MEEVFMSKYHRKEPIRNFDVDQSMYDLVKNANERNMSLKCSSYFGIEKSYASLIRETDKLANALKYIGVNKDDTVGVCLLTVPEVAPSLLAISKINATSYWMDASVGSEDMVKYLNSHNIKTLILFSPLKPVIDQIINKTKLENVILVSPMEMFKPPLHKKYDDERYVDYSDFINFKPKQSIVTEYDRERPSIIVQSSGSTGKSKSIIHTEYNFNSEIMKMAYADLPFNVGSKNMVVAPPWVIYGLVNSIYSSLVLGENVLYTIKPEEDMVYRYLGKFDLAFGVPPYYRYLYDKMCELLKSDNPKDIKELVNIRKKLERVNVMISGGDRLTEKETIDWQQMFQTPIANGYGNNEVVGAAIVSPMYANKPGSIGIPMYGNIVKTFDSENGVMLEDGQVGEICISSDSLFKSYLGDEEETKKNKMIYDGKEWVMTGDLGYVDTDGYVHINGRNKRLIINKLGFKISPINAETTIQNLPFVSECVVVGGKRGENDIVPTAFVKLKEDIVIEGNVETLINDECLKHLKEYERPEYIVVVDEIPHKSNGGKQDFLVLEQMANEYINNQQKILKMNF